MSRLLRIESGGFVVFARALHRGGDRGERHGEIELSRPVVRVGQVAAFVQLEGAALEFELAG